MLDNVNKKNQSIHQLIDFIDRNKNKGMMAVFQAEKIGELLGNDIRSILLGALFRSVDRKELKKQLLSAYENFAANEKLASFMDKIVSLTEDEESLDHTLNIDNPKVLLVKNRPWPINGRINNKSTLPVRGVDIDVRLIFIVPPDSKSSFGGDIDFAEDPKAGIWYKIGPWTWDYTDDGPEDGFREANYEELRAIQHILNKRND